MRVLKFPRDKELLLTAQCLSLQIVVILLYLCAYKYNMLSLFVLLWISAHVCLRAQKLQ